MLSNVFSTMFGRVLQNTNNISEPCLITCSQNEDLRISSPLKCDKITAFLKRDKI